MDFWQIIISLLNILAWPVAIIVIVVMLKDPIKRLIDEVNEFKFGDKVLSRGKHQTQENKSSEALTGSNSEEIQISKMLSNFKPETLNYIENFVKNATNLDKEKSNETKIHNLLLYSKMALLYILFKHIHSLIYGSQLKILDHLKNYGESPLETIKTYYTDARTKHIKFYENYAFESYINFLVQQNLIKIGNNNILSITDWGSDLLNFMNENNLSFDLPY